MIVRNTSYLYEINACLTDLLCRFFFFFVVISAAENGGVSLVGISGQDNVGIVTVYNEASGWSPVCAREWDDRDAQVACRQLGAHGGSSSLYR